MFSIADILRARIGQNISVAASQAGTFVSFGRGSHVLTNVGVDVIETTSQTGEKFYYGMIHIVEIRGV